MDKFTVEEVNLMCVFEGQDRMGMIADINNVIPHKEDSEMVEIAGQVIADINNVIPHKEDSEMVEIAGQVLGKLEAMSDEEFAEVTLEAAE